MKKPKRYKPHRINSRKYSPPQESARAKGYDREWERYRFRFLHHNKFCYCCGNPSSVVDHIIPVRVNREMYFWKVDNYLPLCKKCHDTITAKFDRHDPPKTEEKLRWIKARRDLNQVTASVKVVPFKKGSGLKR